MMWQSRDAHWRVQVIVLDGVQLYRVLTDRPVIMHEDIVRHRTGPVYMGHGWYLAEDIRKVEDISKYVSLEELEEVQ
jgi:hypothetical protein